MTEERGRDCALGCNNIQLSIIIPVYNTSLYLRRCLDSVLEATKDIQDEVEVLIINDGSTDNSPEIIKEYSSRCPYFVAYDKSNGGLSDVKNFGLKRASGEYVIFLDSDDYIDSKMYSTMLKKAVRTQSDVVVCDIELVYDDSKKNVIHSCTVDFRDTMFDKVIDMTMMPASWNKMVKRDLYNGLEFPVGKNNEDVAVTPIVLAKAKNIVVVHEAFYKYYQREGSIQNSRFDERRFVILETAKICMERLDGVEIEKVQHIKGSVYLHQVLALPMYPIRREKIKNRYRMLKKYMGIVNEYFQDIWTCDEIHEFLSWDTKWVQISRRISIFLLKRKLYLLLSIYWTPCNLLYDFMQLIYLKFRAVYPRKK